MLKYGIVALLIVGLATNATSIVMKIQINDEVPDCERFSWWVHNDSAVGRKYREYYPESRLPDIAQYGRWVCGFLFVTIVLSAFFQG